MSNDNGKTYTVCCMTYTDGTNSSFGVFRPAIKRGKALDISNAHLVKIYRVNGGPFPSIEQYYKWAKENETVDCPAWEYGE